MGAQRKIQLSGFDNARYDEGVLSATAKPGMLLQMGTDGRLAPNGTSGAIVVQRICTEQLNTLQGKTVDDAYAADELCSYWVPASGDNANLLLKAGENVVVSDKLISSTDGTFIKTTGTPAQTAWQSEEALDLSGGGAVASLCRAKRI